MKDGTEVFFFGVFVGMVLMLVFAYYIPGSYLREAREAKAQCEHTLPRNQTCVITASPTDAGEVKP